MGARAYRYLSLYEPAPGCLIEIGSERGEGSTEFLAAYAELHSLRFYTTDIDPDAYEAAKRLTDGASLGSGEDMLIHLDGPISVAYMDGFDWIPRHHESEPWIADQRARYTQLGFELNNEICQQTHLREAQLIAKRATNRCVVIVDDTWTEANWTGKGGLAVPYLLDHGFTVVIDDQPEGNSLGYVVLRR